MIKCKLNRVFRNSIKALKRKELMIIMEFFNIIAGMASIISLIISLISLYKVNDIQKNVTNSKQKITKTKIDNGSNVVQVGRDYKDK